jgi:hypothetical protein
MKVFFKIMSSDIDFFNFPYDFNKNDNFFLQLILDVAEQHRIDRPIHFYGCYPEVSSFKKAFLYIKSRFSNDGMTHWLKFQQGLAEPTNSDALNVWCTFENRRPPAEGFDLTFSFDLDTFGGKNFYLPLLYLYISLNQATAKHTVQIETLRQKRDFTKNLESLKTGFASSFINNPHPLRLRAIQSLSNIGTIVQYGRSVNNYVDDKLSESRKFWFNICFENDLFPGYVTEKILEAWLAGAIPLYWGDDAGQLLNPKAFINLKEFSSLEEFTNYIGHLYGNKERMLAMINQPLLNSNLDYQEVVTFIIKGLCSRAER